jgi:hypothetical protein
MAKEKNPSIFDDRGAIGSSDELDTYGVWVKSGPQDVLEDESGDDLPDFGDSGVSEDFSDDDFESFDSAPAIKTEAGAEDANGEADLTRDFSIDFTDSPAETLGDNFSFDEFDDLHLDDIPPADDFVVEDPSGEVSFGVGSEIDDFSPDGTSLDDFLLEDEFFPNQAAETGALNSPGSNPTELSNQLLLQIVNELGSIKTELSSLKDELSIVQGRSPAEDPAPGGFFDGGEDDETIALTGDEMNNILKGADFTEEQGAAETLDESPEAAAFIAETAPVEETSVEISSVDEALPEIEEPALPDLEETPALETSAEEPSGFDYAAFETPLEETFDLPNLEEPAPAPEETPALETPGDETSGFDYAAFEIPHEETFDLPNLEEPAPAPEEIPALDVAGEEPSNETPLEEISPEIEEIALDLPDLPDDDGRFSAPLDPYFSSPDYKADLEEPAAIDEPAPAIEEITLPDLDEPALAEEPAAETLPAFEEEPAASSSRSEYDFEQFIPEAFTTDVEESAEDDSTLDAALFSDSFTTDELSLPGEESPDAAETGVAELALDMEGSGLDLNTALDEPSLDLEPAPGEEITETASPEALPDGVIFEDLELDIPEEESPVSFDSEETEDSFPDISFDGNFGAEENAGIIPEAPVEEAEENLADFSDFSLPEESAPLEENEIVPAEETASFEGSEAVPAESTKPAEAPAASPGEFSKVPDRIKNELKTVLSYMDQLLESLPEEKIEEFARSEYFDTYKKLFEELGLV